MTLSIKLEGYSKAYSGLRKAAKDLGVLEEAERRAADQVLASARSVVPVRTGNLRDSLQNVGGEMFSTAVYSNPIHWGWQKKNIKPNMFLLNTARWLEPNWIRWFEKEIDDALRKAAD